MIINFIKRILPFIIAEIILIIAAGIIYFVFSLNYLLFFILGIAISSLVFFVTYYINERNNLNQFRQLLDSIDCTNSNPVDISDISKFNNNLYSNEIIQFVNRVKRALKNQKKFPEDASHELKTPLTILRGELELALRESKSVDEYQKTLASALDEINRLIRILQSIMEITKAESGKIHLNFRKEDLSGILDNLVDDAKILAEEKKILVNADIQNNIKADVDDLRIHQAFLNIIENAIKYTDKNGYINIKLFEEYENIIFIIKDSGIGIPEEKQKFIFERFYQIKDNPDAKNGVGIGLSIVKWIIDKHKGIIQVNSKINQGTEFIVTIPKVQNEHK